MQVSKADEIQEHSYRLTNQTVRGLRTREQAYAISELTLRSLQRSGIEGEHILSIDERPDGTFDLLVYRRADIAPGSVS